MNLHVSRMSSSVCGRELACYVYMPKGSVRAILQISHGMCDYVENYAPLAEALADVGIALCGNDHLGHGASALDENDLGYFGGGYDALIDDLYKMNCFAKKTVGDLPTVLLGHSMGSFLARAYVLKYPESLDGVIFEGTAGSDNPTGLAKVLAGAIGKLRGDTHRSKLLYTLSFGSYNSRFKGEGEFAWLSRDKTAGERFENDPRRRFIFTANGYHGLFSVLDFVSKKSFAGSYPKELPTYIVAGDADPVGNYGKGPKEVHDRLTAAGVCNVSLKLYSGARHELHNETNKDEFFRDVIEWIEKNVLKK